MNKYKVIYYVVAIALLVSVFLLIGMDLGWFNPYQSDQFIWASTLTSILVVEWIEKKSKNLARGKRRMNMKRKRNVDCYFNVYCLGILLAMFVGTFRHFR